MSPSRGGGGSAPPAARCRIEHYGASADAATLFREFGFTPEHVVAAAKESLAAAGKPAQVSTASNPDVLAHVGSDTGTAHEGGTAND